MYREDGISAGDRSLEIQIESSITLEKLYGFLDEAGVAHRYSMDMGELEASIHGQWLLFYVNKRVLAEEQEQDQAFADAQDIAEGYWKQ